jgi:membrane-bound metal-dependent hydrolase YbcI (DUF457 family)
MTVAPSNEPPSDLLWSRLDVTLKLRDDLRGEVMALSFRAYEELIRLLLHKMGYEGVRIMGRTFRRGRRPLSGVDLEALGITGPTTARVFVLVKQYRRPVQARFVDELRGTMARMGATHGLLITTSHFSGPAIEAADAPRVTPLRLMDGERLLQLLSVHRVGVSQLPSGRLTVNRRLFLYLRRTFPERRRVRSRTSRGPGISIVREKPKEDGGHMTWRTHALIGINTLWLLEAVPNVISWHSVGPLTLVATIGALLPDLDATRSKLSALTTGGIQPLAPFSRLVHAALGHRGSFHAGVGLLVSALLGLTVGIGFGWSFGVAFWLGFVSHLVADALTVGGIPRIYGKGRFHLLPRGMRFVTGSQAEDLLLPFLVALVLLLILSQFPFDFPR